MIQQTDTEKKSITLHVYLVSIYMASAETKGLFPTSSMRITLQPRLNSFLFVSFLKEDLLDKGSLLGMLNSALVTIDVHGNYMVVSGSIRQRGLENGNTTVARYNSVASFLQYPVTGNILIADTTCLRLLEYKSWIVGNHSGQCNLDVGGKQKDGPFPKARYSRPTHLIFKPGSLEIIYVLDSYSIRVIDDLNETVVTGYSYVNIEGGLTLRGDLSPLSRMYQGRDLLVVNDKKKIIMLSENLTLKSELSAQIETEANNDLSRNMFTSLFEQSTGNNTVTTPSYRYETLTDIVDIQPLTDTVVLASASGGYKGIYAINLIDGISTLVCKWKQPRFSFLSMTDNSSSCVYDSDSPQLELVNSTLYLAGSIASRHAAIESLELNGEQFHYIIFELFLYLVLNRIFQVISFVMMESSLP